MRCIFLLFSLLGFVVLTQAQVIKGVVVDDDSGKPVGQAAVFFDNTRLATQTNKDGFFEMELPLQRSNQLIVVADGYDYHITTNVASETNLSIRLTKDDTLLDELIIDKSPFSRKEMMKAFKTYFLGTTPNGKRSKLKNEEDVFFNFNTKTNTLTAFSDKPIEIENKNLGYRITFHLQTFQVQFNAQSLEAYNYQNSFFSGYTQFKEVEKVSKKHIKNRKNTGLLSYVNFFRELIIDDLEKDIFVIGINRYKVDPYEYFDIQQNENGYSVCLIKPPLVQVRDYTKGKETFKSIPTYFNVSHLASQKKSIFEFNANCVALDQYGNLMNPEQISFGGYFGDLKIADMLPIDFYQERLKRSVTNEGLIIDESYTYEEFEKEAVDFYISEAYRNYARARELFLEKLQATYDLKLHEPFRDWIESNLNTTQFVSKEEAVALHSNFVETYKLISKKQKEIEAKENHFAKIYGEDVFNKMYGNSVLKGIIEKIESKRKDEN
ncbi:MAG: carboxypeptidase-like regulatory domain-containing protein [Myroides sp.]|nr:carboxypeptidase-like regulatory domain-containing protein [Myroides sp.]